MHYGYRPETPRTGTTDGIHVDFPVFETQPRVAVDGFCGDNWTHSECMADGTLFKQVKKGTDGQPHTYRGRHHD